MGKWQKGESGNAGGRPRMVVRVRDLARQHTAEAIETLASIMANPKENGSARVAAANALLDRAWGRATLTFDEVAEPPVDLREVARRLAFIMNGAILRGELLDVTPDETAPNS